MKHSFSLLIIFFGFGLFAQESINSIDVPTFSTAAQGDLYVDQNGVYYIGLEDGSLKVIGNVAATGNTNGDILSWNGANWVATAASLGSGSSWELSGNSINSSEFIGTTNAEDLVFRVNNTEVGRLDVNGSIAWGTGTSTNNNNVVSIGASSNVYGNNGVAIGRSSDASVNGVAIGDDANAYGTNGNATALGSSSSAQEYAVAIGHQSDASAINGVAIGRESSVYGNDGVAIGENAQSSTRSIALGADAQSSSTDGIAIGSGANVYGTDGIVIGRGSQAAQNSIAIGADVNAFNANTIILGDDQNVGIGLNNPSAKLEVSTGTAGDSGFKLTNLTSSSATKAEPIGVDNTGKVMKAEKPTLTDNGDGTATFDNGFDAPVTFTTQSSGPGAIVTSTLWIDATSVNVTNNNYDNNEKEFTIPGGTLGSGNAVRVVCYRVRNGGNPRIRVRYGGQSFYETGNLGSNPSSRFEIIIFGNGSTSSQKSFIDDANTGGSGQRFGTTSVNSAVDQTVEIQMRGSGSILDFCSAETLIIGN